MTDADAWRGVAAEQVDDPPRPLGLLLRRRSRLLLGGLLRPHRRGIAALFALIVVTNVSALAGPWLVGVGIDRGIPALAERDDPVPLLVVVAVFVVTLAVQGVSTRAHIVLTGRIGQTTVLALRRRVFDHLMRLSLGFHQRYTCGRAISRQTSDIDAICELLEDGADKLVSAALSLVLVGGCLLVLDAPLALAVLAAFPPLIGLTAWFRRQSATAYRRTREAIARYIVQFVETFTGIRAVQAFRREPRNQEIFEALTDSYRAASARSVGLIAAYSPGLRVVGNLTVAVVLVYGGDRVLAGQMEIGVLTSFLLYVRRFFDPLQELAGFYNSFQSASAALEKLSGVLDEPCAVPEPSRPNPLFTARGAIRLEGVRFGYRERPVLPYVDLDIPAGQTVALVGATGAGKTTLARLIARFYDPDAGRVLLDGVDLRDLDEFTLRQSVVMVTQEHFLFSGSVADNIGLGRPGASRTEIERAARAIGAHPFIAALPQGYDTDVRKRGGRLSAGQRQLVSFARAFLAAPAVLILDEATSSLDIPSERATQRALRTILADRTAVIIAHRLSTVEIADRVLVLDHGRIVEDDEPDRLLRAGGHYAHLHRSWQESLA